MSQRIDLRTLQPLPTQMPTNTENIQLLPATETKLLTRKKK